jgi:hypothetical protein
MMASIKSSLAVLLLSGLFVGWLAIVWRIRPRRYENPELSHGHIARDRQEAG